MNPIPKDCIKLNRNFKNFEIKKDEVVVCEKHIDSCKVLEGGTLYLVGKGNITDLEVSGGCVYVREGGTVEQCIIQANGIIHAEIGAVIWRSILVMKSGTLWSYIGSDCRMITLWKGGRLKIQLDKKKVALVLCLPCVTKIDRIPEYSRNTSEEFVEIPVRLCAFTNQMPDIKEDKSTQPG